MAIKKYFVIFFSLTLFSRFLGLIRDILISHRLGTSFYSDVFFVAFRLPNLFRAIFAEGAFSSVFLPIYVEIRSNLSQEESLIFIRKVQLRLILGLAILIIVMEIFMAPVLQLMAPGLCQSGEQGILVLTARIIFPYIIFISLVALYSGILQANKKFGVVGFCPVILNICLIIALILNVEAPAERLNYLAISIIITGILQTLYCLFFLRINGFDVLRIKLNSSGKYKEGNNIKDGSGNNINIINIIKVNENREGGKANNNDNKKELITANIRKFYQRFIPALLSAEVYQINIFIDTFFASTVLYGVSYLYYADRIMQLPLALIGISLNIIMLPLLTQSITQKDLKRAINVQNKALELAIMLAIPAALGLFFLAEQIIEGLFSMGENFGPTAVLATSGALQVFAFALPAYIFNKIFLTIFFAMGDTKTPLKFALVNLSLNLILNIILVPFYQHIGIAIAAVISGWGNALMIFISLRKRSLYKIGDNIKSTFIISLLAGGFMLIIVALTNNFNYWLNNFLLHAYKGSSPSGPLSSSWLKIEFLILSCLAGVISYFLAFFFLKKIFNFIR